MSVKQTVLILLIGWSFLMFTLFLIQRHRFRERYAILWIVVGLLYIGMPYFHGLAARIGHALGFVESVSFFLFTAIMVLFLLSIQFTVALSVAFNQRRSVIQKVAILEKRILDLETMLRAGGRPVRPGMDGSEPA